MKEAIFFEILNDATMVLKELGVISWLTDGTLLGYKRDATFISHDPDIDIGVWISDWKNEILPAMIKQDFELIHVLGTVDNGLEYSFQKNGVRFDIFFFYKHEETVSYACYMDGIQLKFEYPLFDLIPVDFLGQTFNIPDNTDQYIEIRYGTNWHIPDPVWHWAYSPKNCQVNDSRITVILKFKYDKTMWLVKKYLNKIFK